LNVDRAQIATSRMEKLSQRQIARRLRYSKSAVCCTIEKCSMKPMG